MWIGLQCQKARGRKKMLTKVKSFTFSPNLVDARLSTTALALNRLSRRAFVDVSFSEKSSQRFFNEMYGSTMSLNFPRPGEIERPLSPMALSFGMIIIPLKDVVTNAQIKLQPVDCPEILSRSSEYFVIPEQSIVIRGLKSASPSSSILSR